MREGPTNRDGKTRGAGLSGFLPAWKREIEAAVDRLLRLFELRCGYPPGGNTIGPPATAPQLRALARLLTSLDMPSDLLMLYRLVGPVSLPDVGNGLFIHTPDLVRSIHGAGEPRAIDLGGRVVQVVVFASDGGGTQFALPAPAGEPVYRLPNGAIVSGCYTGEVVDGSHPFGVAADALTAYLTDIRDAVLTFAETGEVHDL